MTILDITYRTYRLPFVSHFSTAHGTIAAREGAILMLTTMQSVVGLGEIAPFPGLSQETLAESLNALNTLIPGLRGMTLDAALDALEREHAWLPPSVICGVEMALLDAMARCGMASPFNSEHTNAIAVNAVIGARSTDDAVNAAIKARHDGFSCVKLKVGVCEDVQEEIARIAAVREALGADIALRLDANEGWTLEQARSVLLECVPYNIQYIEQPLPAQDIEGMRQLRKMVPIALAADEAVRDIQSARLVMQHEAADVLILKPQLVGGLRACRQIVDEAVRHGMTCVLTTTIESGVSVAAALHLVASLPHITLACGLGTLPLLVDDLINEYLSIKNGRMAVPSGSGWGVKLDEEALRRYEQYGC